MDSAVVNDGVSVDLSGITIRQQINQITAALALKADAADVYTKTEADSGFASKFGFNTFVTETYADDMTDLEDAIDLKANSSDVAAALALKANAAEVELITANGRVDANFESGYIETGSYSVGDTVSMSPTSHNNWKHLVVECIAGDVFSVRAAGNSGNRAWNWLDADHKLLSRSASSSEAIEVTITAPRNAAYLLLNAQISKPPYYIFSGGLVKSRLSALEQGKANAADVSAALAAKLDADTFGFEKLPFTRGQYIKTSASSKTVTQNASYKSTEVSCSEGDVFTVSGRGGTGDSISWWAFYDENSGRLTYSGGTDADTPRKLITAPSGAARLVVNIRLSGDGQTFRDANCYRGVWNDFENLKISDLTNDSGFIAAHQSDLPSYYNDYLAGKINDINSLIDNSGDGDDTLLFITDYHRQSNCKNSPAIIRRLMDWTSIKAVFFGGDAQDFETTAGAAIAENDGFKADFEKLWDRMYNIIGNHEFNSHYEAAALTQQQIKLFFIRQQAASYGAVNTYGDYWVDNTAQKIRYFFIGCKENSTIDKEQLKWLFNEFLSVPADYLIVVFSHLTFKHVDEDRTKIFVQGNVSTVAKMMTKYNLRDDSASVTFNFTDEYDAQQSETVTYNYGSAGAWCAAIIGGHTHYDADTTYENLSKKVNNAWVTDSWQYHIPNTETYVDLVPVISTTTDAAQKQQDNTGTLTRTPGTVSEQAFDVIHIDRANHKLIFKRIGAGTNREITYPGPAQNAQPQEV